MGTVERREETRRRLKSVTGDSMMGCEIEKVGLEIAACSQEPYLTEDTLFNGPPSGSALVVSSGGVSVSFDNGLSPVHTLVQIICHDHKGLLYDVMRTLKDYNIQVNIPDKQL